MPQYSVPQQGLELLHPSVSADKQKATEPSGLSYTACTAQRCVVFVLCICFVYECAHVSECVSVLQCFSQLAHSLHLFKTEP